MIVQFIVLSQCIKRLALLQLRILDKVIQSCTFTVGLHNRNTYIITGTCIRRYFYDTLGYLDTCISVSKVMPFYKKKRFQHIILKSYFFGAQLFYKNTHTYRNVYEDIYDVIYMLLFLLGHDQDASVLSTTGLRCLGTLRVFFSIQKFFLQLLYDTKSCWQGYQSSRRS